MKTGQLIRNNKNGKLGFVTPDTFGCCLPEEILVVYEGTTCGNGTDHVLLSEVLQESIIPNHKKCGAGQGEKCCMFLACGADGFECLRQTDMRMSLIFRVDKMNARRHPISMYPKCMDLSDGNIEESNEDKKKKKEV